MKHARPSIARLLVYVGLAAVGLAALRVFSRLWANVAFSFALTALVASIALAIHRRGPGRSSWVGFALFGWAYFLTAFAPAPFNAWRDLLVTAPLLTILEEQVLHQPDPTLKARLRVVARPGRLATASQAELTPWTYWTATDRSNPFSSDSFHRIGHSLCCLGVALAGGIFCRLIRDARDETGSNP